MKLDLNQTQIRVLGCLIEKQLTTPDYYPLTLGALTNACNQKSNREPVLTLLESDVLDAIHELAELNLAREQQMAGARVLKYAHKLSDTLTKEYDFSQDELGVLAILFVRGPQTVGEIRTRTSRMCHFTSLSDAESTVKGLVEKSGGPYVAPMARQPGRQIRQQHLFSASHMDAVFTNEMVQTADDTVHAVNFEANSGAKSEEIDDLRAEVAALRADFEALKDVVEQLTN